MPERFRPEVPPSGGRYLLDSINVAHGEYATEMDGHAGFKAFLDRRRGGLDLRFGLGTFRLKGTASE